MSEGLKVTAVWRVGTSFCFGLYVNNLCLGSVWSLWPHQFSNNAVFGHKNIGQFNCLADACADVQTKAAAMLNDLHPGVIVAFDRDALKEELADE